jgi:hypothetical protein
METGKTYQNMLCVANMKVVKLTKSICDEFVTKKHYSKRASIFWAGFGLIEDNMITGVVVYGQPSPAIQKYAFEDREFRLYELSRLVVQSKTKNAPSFLIGNSMKMLESPCAIVSYSDMEYNHSGIIYQATNWLYTGSTISHDHMYLVEGVRVHSMTLRDKGITSPKTWAKENNIQTIKPFAKHRYFQFIGDKRQKKMMVNKLKYDIIKEYPKSEKTMYDSGEDLNIKLNESTLTNFFN